MHEEFESILRFWLDRGVDGFRIDVAPACQGSHLRDMEAEFAVGGPAGPGHPHWDQDEVHDVYRAWRRLTDAYPGERTFVGEVWVATPHSSRGTCGPTSSTPPSTSASCWPLGCRGDARAIDESIHELAKVGAPPTWV